MITILHNTARWGLCALLTALFVLQLTPVHSANVSPASRAGSVLRLLAPQAQAAGAELEETARPQDRAAMAALATGKSGAGMLSEPGKTGETIAAADTGIAEKPAARGKYQTASQAAVVLDPALVREGDVIFQITNSPQCKAIQMATGSKYTHCGIVLEKDGELMVFEAVRTVSWAPLQQWVGRGVNQHYVLMRLKDPALLSAAQLAAMREDADFFKGRRYDIFFQWGDEEIYCSELVWKLYQRNANLELGPLRTFRDYNLNHEEVQRIARERFGKDIPLDSKVTAPSDIMESDLLEVVAKN